MQAQEVDRGAEVLGVDVGRSDVARAAATLAGVGGVKCQGGEPALGQGLGIETARLLLHRAKGATDGDGRELAAVDELAEVLGHVLQDAGSGGVGADLERIFPGQLHERGDLVEDGGDGLRLRGGGRGHDGGRDERGARNEPAKMSPEGDAAALAAERISNEELLKLKAYLTQMISLVAQQRSAEAETFDGKFHQLIASATRNSALQSMIEWLWALRESSELSQLFAEKIRRQVAGPNIEAHEKIYLCLSRRDAAGAKAAMQSHIAQVTEAYVLLIGE